MLAPLRSMVGFGKPAHERRGSGRTTGGSSSSTAVPAVVASTPAAGAVVPGSQPAWRARAPTREELEVRRCVEKEFVSNNDTSDTDIWHLITMEWLNDWKRFISRQGPLPGPISNDSMLDAKTNKPLPGLQLVHHYRGVNRQIWEFWEQRYGGGPVIRRKELDMYSIPYGCNGVSINGRQTKAQAPSTPQRGSQTNTNQRDKIVPVDSNRSNSASGNVAWTGPPATSSEKSSNATAATPEPKMAGAPSVSPEKSRRSCGGLFTAYRGGGGHASSAGRQSKQTKDASVVAAASLKEKESQSRSMADDAVRSEHPDQHLPLGEGGVPDDRGTEMLNDPFSFIAESDGCIISQPGDGSCLFHSLACVLEDGSTGASLRQEISNYIANNPDMKISDTTLEDWVKFDSEEPMQVSEYAANIAGTTWGGGIEIEAFVRLRLLSVYVYEKCEGGFKRIGCFDAPPGCTNARLLSVLYQGREHYDALLLCQPYDG